MIAVLSIITTVYGIGASFAGLFQVRTMVTRRKSCDVSLHFLFAYVGGDALWLVYGLAISSFTLVVTDIAGVLCGGVTIFAALKYHTACPKKAAMKAARKAAKKEVAA